MIRKNVKSQENIFLNLFLWKMNILYTNVLNHKFMYVHIFIVICIRIYIPSGI